MGTGLKLDGPKHTAAVFGSFTAPLSDPEGFVETYPDAGYGNMASLVKALKEVDFDGCIMNDHLVSMAGGSKLTSEAYFTAYLKGLVDGLQVRES